MLLLSYFHTQICKVIFNFFYFWGFTFFLELCNKKCTDKKKYWHNIRAHIHTYTHTHLGELQHAIDILTYIFNGMSVFFGVCLLIAFLMVKKWRIYPMTCIFWLCVSQTLFSVCKIICQTNPSNNITWIFDMGFRYSSHMWISWIAVVNAIYLTNPSLIWTNRKWFQYLGRTYFFFPLLCFDLWVWCFLFEMKRFFWGMVDSIYLHWSCDIRSHKSRIICWELWHQLLGEYICAILFFFVFFLVWSLNNQTNKHCFLLQKIWNYKLQKNTYTHI